MTKRKKHPGGRPPVAGTARSDRLSVRLTPAERERIGELAAAFGPDATEKDLVRAWIAAGVLPPSRPVDAPDTREATAE